MQEIKQEKSPIKQRILLYLKENGVSMYDCYAKTGITRGILGQNNGISEDNIARFLAYYSEVSTDWLILGRGSMLRSDQSQLPATQPVIQSFSSPEETIIYKLYKEEKEEKEKLNAKMLLMAEEMGRLKRDNDFLIRQKGVDVPPALNVGDAV